MTVSPPGAAPAATIGRRVGAFAIDIGVVYAIGAVLVGIVAGIIFGVGAGWERDGLALMILFSYVGIGLLLFVWWLVYSAMQGGRGSIGQRLLGLRLQDAAAFSEASGAVPIGFGRALWRNIVFGLAGSIVVGYFSPLFDASPRRQGWHDMASKAVVVDMRKAPAAPPAAAPPATANPYLPPPAGAATLPPAPPLRPAAPVPSPGFMPAPVGPVSSARPGAPVTRPAAPVGTGVIDGVPWLTQDPQPSPVVRPPQSDDAFPSVTMPFPAATTTEPLGAAALSAAAGGAAVRPTAPPAMAPATAPAAAAAAPFATAPFSTAPFSTAAFSTPADAASGAPVAEPDEDLDSTRMVVPPPAQRAALYEGAPVIAVLTWDDGARMAVYGRTLYGRNPASEEGAVAIAVRDETLSLSKTHFEIGGDVTGAWILDRHSTNGTTLVRDGVRIPLIPGVRTNLRPGDSLEFGDRRVTVGAL
ncbi:RDD family protein [Microbacterium sp. ZW T2_14]|uniref:RDD family protein n=1 Tax=Microbacterium sp. ZW T2_14 TaxID=3378079 RepID=UPI003852DFE6